MKTTPTFQSRLLAVVIALVAFCGIAYAQQQVQGTSVNGATPPAPFRPLPIAGVTGAGALRVAAIDAVTGALFVIPAPGAVSASTPSGVLTSNGVVPVTIAAGVGGKRVFLLKLAAYNTSTTLAHTFTIAQSGGTVLYQVPLGLSSAAGAGTLALDDDALWVQSAVAGGLTFYIDALGVATDVTVTAITLTQ